MPLIQEYPSIDDRTYEDIKNELRARVPSYTKEWTDLNENEPGMAMLELFAWLSEMLIYRMNQVPKLNYVKFLELIGIELKPDEPARTEVTFDLKKNLPPEMTTIFIPINTKIAADSDEGPVIFETERTLTVLTSRLEEVLIYDGFSYIPHTSANDNIQQSYKPFTELPDIGKSLMLGFKQEFPERTELDITVMLDVSRQIIEYAHCATGTNISTQPKPVIWEYYRGMDNWQAMDLLKDESNGLTRSGHIYLKTPLKGEMKANKFPNTDTPLFWIRARVTNTGFDKSPEILGLRTNTVNAIQAETVVDEVLGGSDATVNQTYTLRNTPIIAGSLQLEINEGDSPVTWTEVPDFFGSKPNDRCYTLDRTTGTVRFGDGRHGRIPGINPTNKGGNIVAKEYQFGGGRKGNLPAESVKNLQISIEGIDSVKNLLPSHSGRNEETLTEAKDRARQSLKSKDSLVTMHDFELHAKQAANVKRAKALPLFHPKFPEISVPGVVSVIIVPDSEHERPEPSEGMMREVCRYLDDRRLLTTELYVLKPSYIHIEINADVTVHNDKDLAKIRENIEKDLLEYLHPLTGGTDGQGWPFGGTVYYSMVSQRVLLMDGVHHIDNLIMIRNGKDKFNCEDIDIDPNQLVFSTRHTIQIRYQHDG